MSNEAGFTVFIHRQNGLIGLHCLLCAETVELFSSGRSLDRYVDVASAHTAMHTERLEP